MRTPLEKRAKGKLLFLLIGIKNALTGTLGFDTKLVLTIGEYNEMINLVKNNPQFKNAPEEQKADNSPIMLMTKERIVQDLIVKKLLDQEYKKRNI